MLCRNLSLRPMSQLGPLAAAASSSQGPRGVTGHPPIPGKHCRTSEIVSAMPSVDGERALLAELPCFPISAPYRAVGSILFGRWGELIIASGPSLGNVFAAHDMGYGATCKRLNESHQ